MTAVDAPVVLGIETSCDETGIGIVRGRVLLADEIASSVDEQARFGGVVPEVASRAHLTALAPTLDRALARAGVGWSDIDAVAVTAGPGLAGALLVSGGHSSLLLVRDRGTHLEPLGATLDDAAGEAFDKVARLLGLPFPGGPWIDRSARDGVPDIPFPRGLTAPADAARHPYDFSFSGLKTAVARWIRAREASGEPVPVADVAASVQEAIADVLTSKAIAACRDLGVTDLVIGGGVAANSRLRAMAVERAASAGIAVRVPDARLCTDNGAMIAAVGARLLEAGAPGSPLDFPTRSAMPVEVVSWS